MATQPAPAETTEPRFNLNDKVEVTDAEIEEDEEYVGKIGVVVDVSKDYDDLEDIDVHLYEVDFSGRVMPMYERQLKLADTIPF